MYATFVPCDSPRLFKGDRSAKTMAADVFVGGFLLRLLVHSSPHLCLDNDLPCWVHLPLPDLHPGDGDKKTRRLVVDFWQVIDKEERCGGKEYGYSIILKSNMGRILHVERA